jgi:acetyl-CoA C-acetyltransferase
MAQAYIVAAVRTAGGRRGGKLKDWHPVDLAAQVINALVARAGADPAVIDDVLMGCVSQIGEQSANVARNAVLASVLPETVPATSIDRQCGSSQQALHFAAQAVLSETQDVVIAAGVESMTRVPMGSPMTLAKQANLGSYLSPEIRRRYQSDEFSQFAGAEQVAVKHSLSKAQLDAFALQSHQKAIAATQAGLFKEEILPLEVTGADGRTTHHDRDEGIRFDASLEGISNVKLINPNGRLSAATASQICDGAAGVLVANERGLKKLGAQPLARIHHMSVLGGDPVVMLEVPIAATQRALERAGLTVQGIDLFEVNEAFASIPLAWQQALNVDPARLNVHGGAIALGHPLGASGAKLMTTLVHALRSRNARFGLQTMCEGGGMANVTIVERC